MKKSLIALAVLAASGAAMAQSSVTLYGVLDIYGGSKTIENKLNPLPAAPVAELRTTFLDSGSVNGSRWGLKGSEDLGGGLSAIFDLQSGINLDSGGQGQGGLVFGRQAFVGFQGGFGAVKLGRVILPFYDNEGMNDVMLNSNLSAQSNVMRTANNWGSGATPAFESKSYGGYVLRGDNALRYDTPNMAGFVGSLAYAMDEKTATTYSTSVGIQVSSASLVYAAGPVSGVLAYQTETPFTAQVVGGTSDRNFLRLSGQYDFGTIIAKAGFGKATNVNFVADAKTSEYQLGLDYKLSAAMLLTAGVASSTDDATATVTEVKRTAYTLGGKYIMSKRTFLYGGYEAGVGKQDGKLDAKESIFAIGMQHRF